MKLLICGSRVANRDMRDYARFLVQTFNDGSIIVGDAEGIDAEVSALCDLLKKPVRVIGAYNKIRYGSKQPGANVTVSESYLYRDRVMVEQADSVIAIWNGLSRGTKYTYDYAVKMGKRAMLVTFKGSIH